MRDWRKQRQRERGRTRAYTAVRCTRQTATYSTVSEAGCRHTRTHTHTHAHTHTTSSVYKQNCLLIVAAVFFFIIDHKTNEKKKSNKLKQHYLVNVIITDILQWSGCVTASC